MKREILTPKNKEEWLVLRSRNINSTDVSALFGLSPYTTEFELWHRKKTGIYSEIIASERMLWGTRLESAIAKGIAEDQGWSIEPMKEYISLPDYRIGSSFDFRIGQDKILEIKNVDALTFKNSWQVDDAGNIEAPPHIEIQVQHQMLVSGFEHVYIGVLVGGNQVHLIHRTASKEIQDAILTRVNEFWNNVDKGVEPTPNFERDHDFIKQLYNFSEPGTEIQPTDHIDELAMQYKEISQHVKELTEKQDSIKAELLMILGTAEKCKGVGYTISSGMVGEAHVNYIRKPYRNFRISYSKGSKNE